MLQLLSPKAPQLQEPWRSPLMSRPDVACMTAPRCASKAERERHARFPKLWWQTYLGPRPFL